MPQLTEITQFIFGQPLSAQLIPSSGITTATPSETIRLIRAAFRENNLRLYKIKVFRMLLAVRTLSVPDALELLDDLVAFAKKNGGDGLDPILIAVSDLVATRGDTTAKKRAVRSLGTFRGVMVYKFSPGPNFLVPVKPASSLLALDLRPVASRAIVDVLLKHSARAQTLGSFLDLLNGTDAAAAMCGSPLLTTPDGVVPPSEREREANCNDHGQPGAAGSGTVSSGLGNLAVSACTLATPTELQIMQARLEAMDQCLQGLGSSNPIAIGPVVVLAMVIAWLEETITAEVVVFPLVFLAMDKSVDYSFRQADADTARRVAEEGREKAHKDAVNEFEAATLNSASAALDIETAEDEADAARKEAESAQKYAKVAEKYAEQLQSDARGAAI